MSLYSGPSWLREVAGSLASRGKGRGGEDLIAEGEPPPEELHPQDTKYSKEDEEDDKNVPHGGERKVERVDDHPHPLQVGGELEDSERAEAAEEGEVMSVGEKEGEPGDYQYQ